MSRISAEPLEVVDEPGALRPREVEELLELAAHRGDVRLQDLAIQQPPLAGRARWIADHPGPTTHQRDRHTAMALEMEGARRSG